MKPLIIGLIILLVCVYAIAFSHPQEWFKWDEWNEHIKNHHKSQKIDDNK